MNQQAHHDHEPDKTQERSGSQRGARPLHSAPAIGPRLEGLALCLLAVVAASPACRERGAGRRDCPPPRALDGVQSFGWPPTIVGGADEAWAGGARSVDGTYVRDVLLRWDGCGWQAAPSPLDGGNPKGMAPLSANGNDLWLATCDRHVSEGDEVFGPDGRISRQGCGRPYCIDGRVFRWRGQAWQEASPPRPDSSVPFPNGGGPRTARALAAVGPDEVWMLDVSGGDEPYRGADGDVRLVRWDGRVFTNVEVDRGIGDPIQILALEDRARSETTRVLWVAGTRGAGRWDGHSWRWFPFVEPDAPYQLAGGGHSDVWAFGLGARHWDGKRWSMVRGPDIADDPTRAPSAFVWAGAAPGGHTFALHSTGAVFRTSDARLEPIGRVRGRVTGLAVGPDELWLWATDNPQPPLLRWRAGSWQVEPAAKSARVTLASDPDQG